MTSHLILILPAHKNIRTLNSSAVEFSHAIMKKLSQHKVVPVALPLLFENKSKQNATVYINNDNRKQKNEITINNQLTQKFSTGVDAPHNLLLNMAKQIMNTTFLKKNNNVINSHTSLQNIQNKEILNIYKQEPLINNMKQTFYSLHKEINIFKSHTKKSTIQQNNLPSKTVQNLIYKSENKLEIRLQNIENKIQHLSKDIITTETKKFSAPQIQQINNKNELTNLSQKVYTLVLKQFKNEQKRKGNLYA